MKAPIDLTLEEAARVLAWPAARAVTKPDGAGAAVYAQLVQNKIGRSLRHRNDARDAQVGVLMADPASLTSEPPLAIVAEFSAAVGIDTLRELHRLAWNFSHAPTLITIEPTQLRVWSCCEAPDPDRPVGDYVVEGISAAALRSADSDSAEARAVQALHWVNLVSGRFFGDRQGRFDRDGRADQMLLRNLRHIREVLFEDGLTDDDICHDLLARVIFVQFLFDRKDQDGNPALTVARLHRLHKDGVLGGIHGSLGSILADYEDSYRLFDWLNTKFNGDLFPGKGTQPDDRAAGWSRERAVVAPRHLAILADFIGGSLDMASSQMSLWPQYAFDVIPLEFISSIYETFVSERASSEGIFYTPPHLVDFILDKVLPWQGEEWDLKVLDPACGSGIFLVKAFQRLVHRWKRANPDETVRAETLRRLLERNIFGVDKDPHAVRVACFSLYLAMCDEIEPRHYWTQVVFPPMRDRRLLCSDFFEEDRKGFATLGDAESYDLIVGNAPWGDGVITPAARAWADDDAHPWCIPNNDIGGLFIAKGAQLIGENGRLALIQSANSLLFNISPRAVGFRRQLFKRLNVESIYNLSALRFRVFKRKTHTTRTSAAPACVMILRRGSPDMGDQIRYVSPKHVRPLVDEFTIVIEPGDLRWLSAGDAAEDGQIWSKLMWGHARDLQLLRRLQSFPRLSSLNPSYGIKSQQGITFGDGTKPAPHLEGRRVFNATMFPPGSFLTIDEGNLPIGHDMQIHSRASTGLDAFETPQLLVKHSWNRATGRFHARVNVSRDRAGIICNQSYLSVHGKREALEAACLSFNSKLAVYYNFLTSGRFAAYRPKLSRDEILSLPLPEPRPGMLENVTSRADLDERVFNLFEFSDAERVLVEDAVEFTLADFLGGDDAKGHLPTWNSNDRFEADLAPYCAYLSRVLKAGFGSHKTVSATIFRAADATPYRLLAISLGSVSDGIFVKDVQSQALLNQLKQLA
ncbi:type I endonuclease-methyltransferase fusion protein [Mesorhizobium tianshanense]|uniref:site-specific DNA-methyltransferase (adenine-specific) n=1 Tax=Mesorhizobium tianshanense TaxID=39844 RepID=A0A562MDT3_9HYPH|nr:N-6 DNA methylase [Mesorhizobium tianshanense]TWI18049.1 N-6 DNA methylase [Mesorhizobium tianshanense]GLS42011.1 type I endonuclease-methyltransferase fusion protein [Mesorhizobium tianshanense]